MDILHEDGRTRRQWNLADPKQAEEAFEVYRRDKPQLVTLSPPCTDVCNLLHMCRGGVPRDEWVYAVRMVNVVVRIAEIQLDGHRHFLFEHPLTASSWRLPSLRRLQARAGVCEATLHMCMFGLLARDAAGVAPAKKPTRILTTSMAIRDCVSRLCDKQHRHVQLVGGRAAAAQQYTTEFCDAIIDGLELELLRRGEQALAAIPVEQAPDVVYELAGEDGHLEPEGGSYSPASDPEFIAVDGVYVDDITGEALDAVLVHEGRRQELDGFGQRVVYELKSRQWAEKNGIPILGTRWVDKKKGNGVRSRLCVQYFNFRKGKAGPDDLFAPTPPLLAARYAASRAATGPRFPRRLRRQLMALDFEKAFLNGKMERCVCIVLPAEDARSDGGRMVGLLHKAMYGLREAPAIWQKVVRQLMGELSFRACVTVLCVYYHPDRDLVVVAHVDVLFWSAGIGSSCCS